MINVQVSSVVLILTDCAVVFRVRRISVSAHIAILQ